MQTVCLLKRLQITALYHRPARPGPEGEGGETHAVIRGAFCVGLGGGGGGRKEMNQAEEEERREIGGRRSVSLARSSLAC